MQRIETRFCEVCKKPATDRLGSCVAVGYRPDRSIVYCHVRHTQKWLRDSCKVFPGTRR